MSAADPAAPAVSTADTGPLDRPIEGAWQATDLIDFNGNRVRFRVMQDTEARWHTHRGSDEFFLVLTGEISIDVRAGGEGGGVSTHKLGPGQMLAVHPGHEHRARCRGRATLVVMDAFERLG